MIKERFRFLWRAWRYRWLLDPAEIRAIRARLQPGDFAIDIGVHKGAYSYWMAKGRWSRRQGGRFRAATCFG